MRAFDETQREMCGFACMHRAVLVPMDLHMCLCVKALLSNRMHAEGPVWKQPMQSYASFSLCHAKTYGRSDIEDTVLELRGYSSSMQFI